jgi:hypothetical protein
MMTRETFREKLKEYRNTPVGGPKVAIREALVSAYNEAFDAVERLEKEAIEKEEQRLRNLPMCGPGSVDE